MNKEEHNRIVDAASKQLKFAPKERHNPMDALVAKAQQTTIFVRNAIKPVLKAGGWKDREALTDLITRQYLLHFQNYSQEELANLCTMLHTQLMLETVDASPWGDDKPDALSGQ